MKYCPNCSRSNKDSASRCECGYPLPSALGQENDLAPGPAPVVANASPPQRKSAGLSAPTGGLSGCLVGGLVIPFLWSTWGQIAHHDSGLPGIFFVSPFLGFIGFWIGLLVNAWLHRTPPLADPELAAELRRMTMESLVEYKGLCPRGSREYYLAKAELKRRIKEQDSPPSRE